MTLRSAISRLAAALFLSLLATLAAAQGDPRWFATDRLNEGLAAPPDDLERATPRGAVVSFIEAVRREDYDLAAHILDLRDVAPERQAALGPQLALQLGEVVERRLSIDFGDLPGRPDARVVPAAGSSPMAGEVRRSFDLGILTKNGRPFSIRLNRLKPGEGEPAWVFSRRTVEAVPALHDKYGPGWFEQRIPEWWGEMSGLGMFRWELGVLPVLLVAGVSVAMICRHLFGWLARLAPWRRARRAALAARTPLALLAAAVFVRFAVATIFIFSAPVAGVLQPLLLVIMAVAVTMAILRAVDTVLEAIERRHVGDMDGDEDSEKRGLYTSIYAFRRLVLLAAVFAAVAVVMSELNLFDSFGVSLLASAGVLTVILGIAGQTVLGNILSSLQIAFAKPIRIGDSVLYEGHWAYVEAIYYTFVRLQTWDGRRLIVPVKYFISRPFENWSVIDSKMTWTFTLTVDPIAQVEALRNAFLEMASKDEDVMQDELKKVLVDGQDAQGLHVRFYVTAADPSTAWTLHARLREDVIRWVSDNHPEWWPRERVADMGRVPGASDGGEIRTSAAAAE